MPKSEEKLLSGARQLDEEALGSIYDAFSSAIFRYALRLIGNSEAAEDVVSETFFRFIRSIQGGGGPKKHLKAYLYRVAHNLIVDQYRRNPIAELDFDTETLERTEGKEDPAYQAEMLIAQSEVRKKLWMLTEEQRQVIVLKYLEGMSNQEVANVLGKPVGAIKSLQHRGLNSLRRMFAKDEQKRSSEDGRT
jgi:RNA polymerase sigma-70 factor (ECF subfamily)